jgi:hypothetical protein
MLYAREVAMAGRWFALVAIIGSSTACQGGVPAGTVSDASLVDVSAGDAATDAGVPMLTQPTVLVGEGRTSMVGGVSELSFDGTHAVIGAPGDPFYATNGGRARAFTRSGASWTEDGELLPTFTRTADAFLGGAIAITDDGMRAVFGVRDDRAGTPGTVHVLSRTGATWIEEQSLTPPVGAVIFGPYVAISGDGTRILVTQDDGGAGRALVYARGATSWSLEATLDNGSMASDGSVTEFAISTDGAVVVVSAPSATTATGQTGTARMWIRGASGWGAGAVLDDPAPQPNDGFGVGPAISGDARTVFVGALGPYHDSGRIEVFAATGSGWAHETTLVAPSGHQLGDWAVSADGSRVIALGLYASAGAQTYVAVFERGATG